MSITNITKLTRSFVLSKISRPANLVATFKYNFFTADERISEDGLSRFDSSGFLKEVDPVTGNRLIVDKQGRLVEELSANAAIPRYVEINFSPADDVIVPYSSEPVDIEKISKAGKLNRVEDMSSPLDAHMKFIDLNLASRLTKKLELLSIVKHNYENYSVAGDEATFSNTVFTTEGLASIKTALVARYNTPGLDEHWSEAQQILNDLINVNRVPDLAVVNEVGSSLSAKTLDEASSLLFQGTIDSRVLKEAVDSDSTRNYFSRRKMQDFVNKNLTPKQMQQRFPSDSDPMLDSAYPRMANLSAAGDKKTLGVRHIGYIIERFEGQETLVGNQPESTFFVNSADVNSFVDTKIKYGATYYYSVRAAYEIKISTKVLVSKSVVERTGLIYLASQPTDPVFVTCEEQIPPEPPDGIFYKFNYSSRRGLIITWQYPVGTQRDVKYFQIFRRSTINEAFTCIAELDFDNSFIRVGKREAVRPDKIIKLDKMRLFYEDPEFNKASSYIYAVASVDAHGYTSGYSNQVHVSFDPLKNNVMLKAISPSGAPKQYPNFYVDPDMDDNVSVNTLTQDVMKSSLKRNIYVYFDADAINSRLSTGQETKILRLKQESDGSGGIYKLLLINTDRQKSESVEIYVEDVRTSE